MPQRIAPAAAEPRPPRQSAVHLAAAREEPSLLDAPRAGPFVSLWSAVSAAPVAPISITPTPESEIDSIETSHLLPSPLPSGIAVSSMVTCSGGSWQSEVHWTLSCTDGTHLSGGAPYDSGSPVYVAVGAGCTLDMTDSFGDGWNGNVWQGWQQTFSVPTGYSGTGSFTVAMPSPSMPPGSPPQPPSPPPPSPSPKLPCSNTDGPFADRDGDNCEDYSNNPVWCSSAQGFDTSQFTASMMCCACGGGQRGEGELGGGMDGTFPPVDSMPGASPVPTFAPAGAIPGASPVPTSTPMSMPKPTLMPTPKPTLMPTPTPFDLSPSSLPEASKSSDLVAQGVLDALSGASPTVAGASQMSNPTVVHVASTPAAAQLRHLHTRQLDLLGYAARATVQPALSARRQRPGSLEICEVRTFEVSYEPVDERRQVQRELVHFDSTGVLRAAISTAHGAGSCCHEYINTSLSKPMLHVTIAASVPFLQAESPIASSLRTARADELRAAISSKVAALPTSSRRLPPPTPPPPSLSSGSGWSAWADADPCPTAPPSCVLSASAAVSLQALRDSGVEPTALSLQLARGARGLRPVPTCHHETLRMLLPITVVINPASNVSSGLAQLRLGTALTGAISRAACAFLAQRRIAEGADATTASRCEVRAVAAHASKNTSLGDLQFAPKLSGTKRLNRTGAYTWCGAATAARNISASSGSDGLARLTDGSSSTRWESAPVASSDGTASVTVDLGSEQQVDEVEVVWHLQHPSHYEVQVASNLSGSWETRAVQQIGVEDDASVRLAIASPVGRLARYVRVFMSAPAAVLRANSNSSGYSIWDLRVCSRPSPAPGALTGRCAAAAAVARLHLMHFEVRAALPVDATVDAVSAEAAPLQTELKRVLSNQQLVPAAPLVLERGLASKGSTTKLADGQTEPECNVTPVAVHAPALAELLQLQVSASGEEEDDAVRSQTARLAATDWARLEHDLLIAPCDVDDLEYFAPRCSVSDERPPSPPPASRPGCNDTTVLMPSPPPPPPPPRDPPSPPLPPGTPLPPAPPPRARLRGAPLPPCNDTNQTSGAELLAAAPASSRDTSVVSSIAAAVAGDQQAAISTTSSKAQGCDSFIDEARLHVTVRGTSLLGASNSSLQLRLRQLEKSAQAAGLGAGVPYAEVHVDVATPPETRLVASRGAVDDVRLVLATSGLVGSAETLAGKLALLAANKRQLEWVLQAAVLDDPAPTMSVSNHVSRCHALTGAQPVEKASTSGESANVAKNAEAKEAQAKRIWNWWAKSQREATENVVRSQADAETWWPAQAATRTVVEQAASS